MSKKRLTINRKPEEKRNEASFLWFNTFSDGEKEYYFYFVGAFDIGAIDVATIFNPVTGAYVDFNDHREEVSWGFEKVLKLENKEKRFTLFVFYSQKGNSMYQHLQDLPAVLNWLHRLKV